MRLRMAASLALLLTAACGDETITRARVPKGAAAGLRPAGKPPRGLAWTLPAGWKELPGDGMRLATFSPPGGLKTEATVVALPGESGGELANANRWRGQIGLPPTDEAGMAAARTTLSTGAGRAEIYDFTSAGARPARLIAAAVDVGGMTWFFKLKGDASATAAARPAFLALVKGLRPDAAK